jgi:hypothetical protein
MVQTHSTGASLVMMVVNPNAVSSRFAFSPRCTENYLNGIYHFMFNIRAQNDMFSNIFIIWDPMETNIKVKRAL